MKKNELSKSGEQLLILTENLVVRKVLKELLEKLILQEK